MDYGGLRPYVILHFSSPQHLLCSLEDVKTGNVSILKASSCHNLATWLSFTFFMKWDFSHTADTEEEKSAVFFFLPHAVLHVSPRRISTSIVFFPSAARRHATLSPLPNLAAPGSSRRHVEPTSAGRNYRRRQNKEESSDTAEWSLTWDDIKNCPSSLIGHMSSRHVITPQVIALCYVVICNSISIRLLIIPCNWCVVNYSALI